MSHSKETELVECVWWIISMTIWYTQITWEWEFPGDFGGSLLLRRQWKVTSWNKQSSLNDHPAYYTVCFVSMENSPKFLWLLHTCIYDIYIYIYVSRYHRTSYHHQHFACSSFAGVASFTVQALGCHWDQGVHWDCGWWAKRASKTTLSWDWFVRCYVRDYTSLNCIHSSSRSWFWKEDIWVTVTNQDFLWDGVRRSSL